MRLLAGPGVFSPNAMQAFSFTPELVARLVDACLHELLRLLRPYTLKPLKPWQHGPQHSLVEHLSRGGLPRRFGRVQACRFPHLLPLAEAKGVLHPHMQLDPCNK